MVGQQPFRLRLQSKTKREALQTGRYLDKNIWIGGCRLESTESLYLRSVRLSGWLAGRHVICLAQVWTKSGKPRLQYRVKTTYHIIRPYIVINLSYTVIIYITVRFNVDVAQHSSSAKLIFSFNYFIIFSATLQYFGRLYGIWYYLYIFLFL